MSDFTMPSLGADMEAGTLVEWKIQPGDTVHRGDIVAVVETQKGAIDVEIFQEGQVEALLVEPGTKVPVGTVLARIEGGASEAQADRPSESLAGPAESPTADRAGSSNSTERDRLRATPPAVGSERTRASPAARAAARELGIDLKHVRGTGPSGAITREDVERVSKAHPGMRQAIAAAMSRSNREIPHYYLSTRIDLTAALDWLRLHNEPLKPAQRLLPVVLLIKAVAVATEKVPDMSGYFVDGVFQPAETVRVGLAISLREGGLMVPALHNAANKSLDVLGTELNDLIERSRRGQLRSSEIADATITVTSLGERGVEEVFGCIFPPQVALVGFGKIVQSPAVVDGQCVARPTITATLAADHRASDGHRGGLFLSRVTALLQEPNTL